MNLERTIAEIEWLERLFSLPDRRPFGAADREAANRRHDEKNARNPWFRMWQDFGICTRSDAQSSPPYPESKLFGSF